MRLPVCFYDVQVGLLEILTHEQLHDLLHTAAVVKRLDQRLNDRDRPVVRTGIAPRFEIMLFGDMPMAKFPGFVQMISETNTERNLVHTLLVQFQVDRRVVNRIAAEYHEHFHPIGIDVGYKLAELFDLRSIRRSKRIGINDRLPDVPKRPVHCVR